MSYGIGAESVAIAPERWAGAPGGRNAAGTAAPGGDEPTRASSDSLRAYLRELGAVDLLDGAEEARLSRRMRSGRRALALLARRIPADSRREVLQDLDTTRPAAEWTLAELERFYRQLTRQARRCPDPELAALARRARQYKRRHDEARETMTLANLKLVVHIAKRYSGCGVPLLDLIQDGNIGLLSAVDKFEHHRGNRFSTYAYWWIKQAIDRSIADRGRLIRIPVHLGDQRRKVARSIADLKQRLHRDPSPQEIALRSGLPLGKVERVLGLAREPMSLDTGSDDRCDPLDSVEEPNITSPFRQTAHNELCDKIRGALGSLQPREEEIVRLRFGIGFPESHTLEEIGDMMDLSRERIRQIQAAAMKKLHDFQVLESLLEYSGIG
jgi:RNA polymerase primary sigma factor